MGWDEVITTEEENVIWMYNDKMREEDRRSGDVKVSMVKTGDIHLIIYKLNKSLSSGLLPLSLDMER